MGFQLNHTLSESGGVSRGICFYDELQHLTDIGGIEVLALGSDFDGISGQLEVASPLDFEKLYNELYRRGFTSSDIEKFSHGNAERILREVL